MCSPLIEIVRSHYASFSRAKVLAVCEGGVDFGDVLAAGHGQLRPAAAGAADDGRDGFDPVAGLEFADERIADGGQKVDLGRELVAVLIGVVESLASRTAMFCCGCLFLSQSQVLRSVSALASGTLATISAMPLTDSALARRDSASKPVRPPALSAESSWVLLPFFVAVLQFGDGGLGAALGEQRNVAAGDAISAGRRSGAAECASAAVLGLRRSGSR